MVGSGTAKARRRTWRGRRGGCQRRPRRRGPQRPRWTHMFLVFCLVHAVHLYTTIPCPEAKRRRGGATRRCCLFFSLLRIRHSQESPQTAGSRLAGDAARGGGALYSATPAFRLCHLHPDVHPRHRRRCHPRVPPSPPLTGISSEYHRRGETKLPSLFLPPQPPPLQPMAARPRPPASRLTPSSRPRQARVSALCHAPAPSSPPHDPPCSSPPGASAVPYTARARCRCHARRATQPP